MIVQPIATWLVARPQNGVLGLAGTLLLPLSPVISGLVMTLLVLQHGLKVPALQATAAATLMAAIALLVSVPVGQILLNAGSTWLPALVLAMMVRRWRSLALALQVSAILAIVTTLAFFVVLGDPTDYWNGVITSLVQVFRDNNLMEQADLLLDRQADIAPQMTMLFVFFSWSLYVLVLLLGYALYQCLPGQEGVFGRFRDLNFGRVLASILAVTSVLALFTGAAWLQNVAFVVFTIFWIQGLAWLHWLRAHGRLPVFVLIAAYALLPVLNVVLIVAFAVVGYTDAWFDYRAKGIKGMSA
jgi:hypothetical protein